MHMLMKIRFIQTPSSKNSLPLFSVEYAQCLQWHFLLVSSVHLAQLLQNIRISWSPELYTSWPMFYFTHKVNNTDERINVHARSQHFQWWPKWQTFLFSHKFTRLYQIKKLRIKETPEFLKLGASNFPAVTLSNLFHILTQ